MKKQSDAFDAKIILDKGWRQGSIFHPGDILQEVALSEGELLIICTQSCTVVSPRYSTDPVVEAMVVKTLAKYNSKSFEATGKNQRKVHLEVSNHPQIKNIECDINRRFFFDRRVRTAKDTEIQIQWINRCYDKVILKRKIQKKPWKKKCEP